MMRLKVAPPNVIDRLVGYFAPGKGLARVRDRTLLASMTGGYKGGKLDRRATKNWRPGGGSANTDLLPELETLRDRSRDAVRNIPIATGAIATKKTHVVGEGLQLNVTCDRETLGITEEQARKHNKLAEREWQLFCSTADFTRVQHFSDMQFMLFGGVLESGDIFAIRRYRLDASQVYGTKVQVIEADRVSNPGYRADTEKLAGGVEFDGDGVPVAIHVASHHPGDRRAKAIEWRRVPLRFNDGRLVVLHLLDRQRPEQARGAQFLAPVMELLKSLGDFTDAEVRGALVAAMFAVFVKKSPDADTSPLPTSEVGSNGKDEIELGSGAVIDLADGEDISIASGARPNPQFDAFMTAILSQIGVALELPLELLVKHFTASYSASRAALEMAWHTFRRRRSWFARNLCQPVFDWFMEEAVLTGRLDCPGFFDDPLIRAAWCATSWSGPVRLSLNPKLEAEADEIDINNRVKTRQQVMTERTGGDFDQKTEQGKREQAALDGAFGRAEPSAPKSANKPGEPETDADKDEDEE